MSIMLQSNKDNCSEMSTKAFERLPKFSRIFISLIEEDIHSSCLKNFHKFIFLQDPIAEKMVDELEEEKMINDNENKTEYETKENFLEKVQRMNKTSVILQINDVISMNLICNDGSLFEKVGIIEKGKITLRKQFGGSKDPFNICNIPMPGGVFRVAYNIWKPFVFKRKVTNYTEISEENASVLDGIDIQVSKLIGRKLGQPVLYTHCWWSWGQLDKETGKWIGAVGKVKNCWSHWDQMSDSNSQGCVLSKPSASLRKSNTNSTSSLFDCSPRLIH